MSAYIEPAEGLRNQVLPLLSDEAITLVVEEDVEGRQSAIAAR